MKPRVFHVAAFANAAGGGFVSSIAHLGKSAAVETTLLCPRSSAKLPWVERLESNGVHVLHASNPFDVTRTVARHAPDIVHAHFVDWMLPATLGALSSRARVAWHLHTGVTRGGGAREFARRLKYASARHLVDRFFCVSPELVEYLRGYGIPSSRIAELPNGVDLERFRPPSERERLDARAAFGLTPADRAVAFFGRDAVVKGADRLAAALDTMAVRPRVVAVAPSRETLRVLGANPVIDAGCVMEIRQLYWACDALALPSRVETLTYALLEARACALPAVVTPLGALTRALHDDAGTTFVDPEDASAFAAAMNRALARGRVSLEQAPASRISIDAWTTQLERWYASPKAA